MKLLLSDWRTSNSGYVPIAEASPKSVLKMGSDCKKFGNSNSKIYIYIYEPYDIASKRSINVAGRNS